MGTDIRFRRIPDVIGSFLFDEDEIGEEFYRQNVDFMGIHYESQRRRFGRNYMDCLIYVDADGDDQEGAWDDEDNALWYTPDWTRCAANAQTILDRFHAFLPVNLLEKEEREAHERGLVPLLRVILECAASADRDRIQVFIST